MHRHATEIIWLLFLAVVSSFWCFTTARTIGPTFDEPTYLEYGLERWHSGSYYGLMDLGTMPLPVDVQTLPLYLYEQARGRPIDITEEMTTILPVARTATLLFWWLLLVYGYLLARRLGGIWAGRIAAALIALEPNLLAHASLATTDLAIACCCVMLAYHFSVGRGKSWLWRIAVPSIFFGLAILSKASGFVFGPIVMLAFEWDRLLREGAFRDWKQTTLGGRLGMVWRSFTPWRYDLHQIVPLGLLFAFLYCGTDWQAESSFVQWAHELDEGPAKTAMVWTSENLCLFSNAGEGIAKQIKHNVRGHGTYLFGESWRRSYWLYFPIALSIKLTLPILLAPLAIALLRRRGLRNAAMMAAGMLLLFSLNCRVQTGIRMMLPLISLALVGIAIASVDVYRNLRSDRARKICATVIVGGISWLAVASAAVWPHGLCYINEIWGGTESGYRHLSDSNYDWGQGVEELTQWSAENEIPKVYIWYFGADPAACFQPYHLFFPADQPLPDEQTIRQHFQGHVVAVGISNLYSAYNDETADRVSQYLRDCEPVDRTTTFMIYDFREPIASRLQSVPATKLR